MLFVVSGIYACSDGDTMNLSRIESSSLGDLNFSEKELIEPAIGEDELFAKFNWSKAEFYFDDNGSPTYVAPVNYSLQLDLAGNNFSNPVTVLSTQETSAEVTVRAINRVLLKTDAEIGDYSDIEFRLVIKYGEGSTQPITSKNTLSMKIKTYDPKYELKYIYIIGEINGWNDRNTDYIIFRDDNNVLNGVYTYTGYFNAASEFKLCVDYNLGKPNKMFCAGDGGTLILGTGNPFKVTTAGYYTVSIDVINMTWDISPYAAGAAAKIFDAMSPVGEFSNWGALNEPNMTKSSYDPHQWNIAITFADQTTCKFRANNQWSDNWGSDAVDIPYAKAWREGPGVTVPGGSYRIYFNDLTGHSAIVNNDAE
jgi:hypothetical protein